MAKKSSELKEAKRTLELYKNNLSHDLKTGKATSTDLICNGTYNLGIPIGAVKDVKLACEGAKVNLFGSDADVISYYKNYDSNKEASENSVINAYESARARKESICTLKKNVSAIKKADREANESKTSTDTTKSKSLSERFNDTNTDLSIEDYSGEIADYLSIDS